MFRGQQYDGFPPLLTLGGHKWSGDVLNQLSLQLGHELNISFTFINDFESHGSDQVPSALYEDLAVIQMNEADRLTLKLPSLSATMPVTNGARMENIG